MALLLTQCLQNGLDLDLHVEHPKKVHIYAMGRDSVLGLMCTGIVRDLLFEDLNACCF